MSDIPREAKGFLVKAEIRQSPGKGLGVFAAEFIPANKPIYTTDPLSYTEEEAVAYLESLPTNKERKEWLSYAYGSQDKICIDLDDRTRINHSEIPTIVELPTTEETSVSCAIAARDIEENEELTEDYRTYSPTPAYNNVCKKYGLIESFYGQN